MPAELAYLLLVPVIAILNRARGDDRWMPAWLPGRPLYYVAPVVGLLAGVVLPWPQAVAIGLGYLIWGIDAWGRWFDLGRMPVLERPRSATERLIEAISFGSDHVALYWRHFLWLLPLFTALAWLDGNAAPMILAPLFAATIVAAYELAWRIRPREPIIVAEMTVGALWGGFIILLSSWPPPRSGTLSLLDPPLAGFFMPV